jgi:hypothetical protein
MSSNVFCGNAAGRKVYVTCVHPKLSQSVQQRLMFRATATARQKICDFGL